MLEMLRVEVNGLANNLTNSSETLSKRPKWASKE